MYSIVLLRAASTVEVTIPEGGLPPGVIIGVLEPLSKLHFYSCDGIVNWQVLKTASDISGFLHVLGLG